MSKNNNFEAILAKLMAQDIAIAASLSILCKISPKEFEYFERILAKQKVPDADPQFEQLVRNDISTIFSLAREHLNHQ